ncbi:hypothetical protein CFH99_02835 [Nocardioides aromaticivorans]|uniref:NlpC/P60 domain-containing protein n=1 Tax=Nocardioides aromaticivorans TaxID=200618 RepID=A0ABX7PFG0_9ACTN|nr:hypothetical protein CFH99_02835 [Nocardioides aromaticivorans]
MLTAGVVAPAIADPDGAGGGSGSSTPSAADVRAAKERAADARTDVDGIQERLAAADDALDAASVRAAKAAEAWNGARWEAQQARVRERTATAASARADKALRAQKAAYRDVLITTNGAGTDLAAANAILAADDMQALLEETATKDRVDDLLDQQRAEYDAAAGAAAKAEESATAAADEAEQALAKARTARDAAQAEADAAAATARRVGRQKVRLVATLARLQGVSVAVAQRRQEALESETRRARAAATPDPEPRPDPQPQPADDGPAPDPAPADPEPADPAPADPPAPSGGAQAAIAFARAQLGEPYQWGAAGPGSWDCSGLTSKAWAAGGKSLPHYSVAQYDVSTPISAGQLRPGDLVFWGDNGSPSSIYHVALYVGGGRIIHAPRTGRPVTEESMYYWRTPDFYARP